MPHRGQSAIGLSPNRPAAAGNRGLLRSRAPRDAARLIGCSPVPLGISHSSLDSGHAVAASCLAVPGDVLSPAVSSSGRPCPSILFFLLARLVVAGVTCGSALSHACATGPQCSAATSTRSSPKTSLIAAAASCPRGRDILSRLVIQTHAILDRSRSRSLCNKFANVGRYLLQHIDILRLKDKP